MTWVVYDHPSDVPEMPYIARQWIGSEPTRTTFASADLGIVRRWLEWQGLVRIERSPEDDPVILEVWL